MPGTTYGNATVTVNGQIVSVEALVNHPVWVQRMLRTLAQQRLVGDRILSGRVDLTGSGSAVFETSESIFPDRSAERTAALQEYGLTADEPGLISAVNSEKWALATEISDELVARNRMDQVMRKMRKLANRIAFDFDALVLSAVGSQVTQTQAAAAAWSAATADPLLDTLLATATSDSLNQGYEVNVILARPIAYARLLAASKVIERLPREGDQSPILTGRMVEIGGLTIIKTTNLPAGVDVMVLDSTQLGSIGWEALGGGYVGDPGDVESKTFRLDKNDGWRIQARKVAVPMVIEPGAAVKLTGV